MVVLYQGVVMAPATSDDHETTTLPEVMRVAVKSILKKFTFSDQYFDFIGHFDKKKASDVNYIYEESEYTVYILSSDPECHDLLFSSISAAGGRSFIFFLLPHITVLGDVDRYCEATHAAAEHCSAIQEKILSGADIQSATNKVLRKIPRSTTGFSDRLSLWQPAKRETGRRRHSSPIINSSVKPKRGASGRTSQTKSATTSQSPITSSGSTSPVTSTAAQSSLQKDCDAKDTLLNELRHRLEQNEITITDLRTEINALLRAADVQAPRVKALQKELQAAQLERDNAIHSNNNIRVELDQQLLQKDAIIEALQNQLRGTSTQSYNMHDPASPAQVQLQTVLTECGKRDRLIAQLEGEVRKLKEDMLKKFCQLEEEQDKIRELEAKDLRGLNRAHDSVG